DVYKRQVLHGVRVVRAPVLMRVSKGVIMPTFGVLARRLMRVHDVVHIHLPQFDGAGLAINARLFGKPSLLTYHCDIRLPAGVINAIAQPVIALANRVAADLVERVVTYTEDYAHHSPFLSRYVHKLTVIPPPVEMPMPTAEEIAAFRRQWRVQGGPVIGMAARLASEKGVEVLVRALHIVRRTHPSARVLFAGPHRNVLGEEAYARRLQPEFEALGEHWTFLGSLEGRALSAFFGACDLTVLPSLNATESFGLVQVESMLCGTPSICSDLPGVRVPVQTTGMGEVVPVGDAEALAQAILRVYAHRERYVRPRHEIERYYSTERTAREYTQLYERLLAQPRAAWVHLKVGR
ncbi:MAG: glycosyltransferase family 4 protein, partial [Thermoflexales bacterium]|nr:glycosyltransferase family 4 protein [Thermoflexales bacterium]